MPFEDFLEWIENWPLSMDIASGWMFPFFETIHVLAATFLVGSLLMVDLRLMGLAAVRYPVRKMSEELMAWTWAAFVIALLAGLMMFITQPNHYVPNPAFQIKMILLLLAGANMAVFHKLTWRTIGGWDSAAKPPLAARAAGGLSLLLWVGVVVSARWIGHLMR